MARIPNSGIPKPPPPPPPDRRDLAASLVRFPRFRLHTAGIFRIRLRPPTGIPRVLLVDEIGPRDLGLKEQLAGGKPGSVVARQAMRKGPFGMDRELVDKIERLIRAGNVAEVAPLFNEHPDWINPPDPVFTWIQVVVNNFTNAGGTRMLRLLIELG